MPIDLSQLRVSLTKNGAFKVAELLKVHPRLDVLDHARDDHDGINIIRSQVANMMDANTVTNDVPDFWDAIREFGPQAIDAFTAVAMLVSHEKLIRLMQGASHDQPEFNGYFLRTDLKPKEFTNLAYALGCFGLSDYRRGAGAVRYTLEPVVYHLQRAGHLVRALLRVKMLRAGWRDPERHTLAPDRDLMAELQANLMHRVFSMEWPRFSDWLNNRLTLPRPPIRFGLHEVGLFSTPIALPDER